MYGMKREAYADFSYLCASLRTGNIFNSKMENTNNQFYMVSYKLYTIDKEGQKVLREEAPVVRPYQFITGMGIVLEAFEKEMLARKQGEKFEFTIPCEQAYGPRDEESVISLPRTTFEVNGKFDSEQIYPEAIIPLMDNEGHRFPATVVEVGADKVTVDLNYPLAGSDLLYEGEVIDARSATNEEIQGLLNMLSGEGCGCGCGGGCDCGEGGCDGCGDGECGHHGDGDHCGHHDHEGCGHGHCHQH